GQGAAADAEDHAAVPADQHGERGLIARPGKAAEQVLVAQPAVGGAGHRADHPQDGVGRTLRHDRPPGTHVVSTRVVCAGRPAASRGYESVAGCGESLGNLVPKRSLGTRGNWRTRPCGGRSAGRIGMSWRPFPVPSRTKPTPFVMAGGRPGGKKIENHTEL